MLRGLLVTLVTAAMAGCGTASSGSPGARDAQQFATTPTAAPSPTVSYACGEGPPRHAGLLAVSGTGTKRWMRELPDPVESEGQVPPVVTDDTVFVMSAGRVVAVAADDGKVRWSTDVGGKTGYGLWLAGRTVVASTDQVGTDAVIVGLDSTSGRNLWTYRPGGDGLLGDQLLTSDGGLAMVDSAGRTVVIDLATGSVRWHNAGPVQAYGLGVAGDVVLRGVGGVLTAYDSDGHEIWHHSVVEPAHLDTLDSTVVVTAGATGPSIDGAPVAFEAQSGRRLWRVAGNGALGYGGGGPAGIALYAEDGSQPFLLVVDPSTGAERWRTITQIALFLPATVAGNELTTLEGGTSLQKDVKLIRRDLRSGKVLSSVILSASPLSGPIDLTASRTAVAVPPATPQQQSTVAAYDGGEPAWSVDVPSFVSWVAAGPDGGAYIQTLDPSYACAS